MIFNKQCDKCGFKYEYEGCANLIAFCPECNKYDFLECEFGYGPVVPCRIYHGSKVVGMVTYNEGHEKRYRIDSDIYNLHIVLENSYLEALYEARDIFSEIINVTYSRNGFEMRIDRQEMGRNNMDRKEILENYYSEWNEDDRLLSRFGQVEFLTTIRFVEKYLKPRMKILEIGAGTGRYSHYFARKGYVVDAVELVGANIEGFKAKTLPNENVSIVQGDAVNLSMLKDNEYDIVLHLGPMYHLIDEVDRKSAISEALRVVKTNGKVFMAYIMNEMTVINYFFRNGHINNEEERNDIMSSNWRFYENNRKQLAFYRIEDVNALMGEFDVNRLHLVGTEMISGAMRDMLLSMSDEEFLYYTEYIYSICERADMIGMSGHLLDVFEKK